MLFFSIEGVALAQSKLTKADEAILQGFTNRYKGMTSLKAEYIRSTVTPSTDPIFKNQAAQTAVGTLYWRKPYNLRLDQTSPAKEEMVVDGTTAWWYIPGEKQVYVYRNLDLDSEYYSLMSFFDGVDELRKNFKVSTVPASESRGVMKGFALTPNGKDRGGTIVVFCDNDQKLQGFRINSATGERTDFFINYISPNPSLEEGIFQFKTPKGVKTVEESGE
ncbi:MAG: outer membrane lipoprotein carrier protein LolA [Deltaproteobacteria bacterium]|jgi:outer membrane lipoprotein-sorting protein|nr:outer membrane lipoprotein carrier protein LolA [Deltaproteobacteria bacterium]